MQKLKQLSSCSVLVLLLVLFIACAHRPVHVGTDYLVGQECHASVRLLGCDPGLEHCQKVILDYPKGCETVALHK